MACFFAPGGQRSRRVRQTADLGRRTTPAEGDLKQHLPGWLWGKKDDEQWTLLDSNSASDSDLWIASGAAGGGPPVATAAVHRDRKSPAGADCR